MRKLLNTLYVTTSESYLSLDGNNIVLLVDGQEKFRIPFGNIENIICFSYLGVSPAFMEKCVQEGISVNFVSPSGKYQAGLVGAIKGNVTLRRAQYRLADDEARSLAIAKNIVAAKLKNSAYEVNRTIRDHADTVDVARLQAVEQLLKRNIATVFGVTSKESLLAVEGESARIYFMSFDEMILNKSAAFRFLGREKRPPTDNVNAMLSYFYTILGLEYKSALECVGLDPYVGFYHTDRSGRHSLALDLMEELRAVRVDRFVLSLVNLGQVTENDFLHKEGGAVLMTDDGRRKILKAWQEKKSESITHPHINEKIKIGLIPYVQAQLLAGHIRGDADEYMAYLR
ncbi:MAG: type I-C CRISPR-associated endonuclease Cas1c [Clostridiales bacterium]|jgi:CRISPR-associated protein Cas1|nr:type I-C CRISPR-associated endonuclease Cas1c [Clostridiales bacterium]